jgi:plasmid replication initiation protein
MQFIYQFNCKWDHYSTLHEQQDKRQAWTSYSTYLLNLTIHQQGIHYIGIRIFNSLPPYIKDVSNNVKKFEYSLKQFLCIHSFYSLEEYFQHNFL